jgi:hypothetical protein
MQVAMYVPRKFEKCEGERSLKAAEVKLPTSNARQEVVRRSTPRSPFLHKKRPSFPSFHATCMLPGPFNWVRSPSPRPDACRATGSKECSATSDTVVS